MENDEMEDNNQIKKIDIIDENNYNNNEKEIMK